MRVFMDMKFMKNIVVIIPVYHPDIKFNALLRMLKKQEDILFDVYIVNSGSDKGKYATDLEGYPTLWLILIRIHLIMVVLEGGQLRPVKIRLSCIHDTGCCFGR